MSAREWIIVNDSDSNLYRDTPAYFIRLGLGVFWEASSRKDEARRFQQRRQAAKMLTSCGKQHEGWRVVSV